MRIPQTHLVFPQESWRDAMCASHIPRLHRPATRRPTCPAVKQRAGVGAQLWEGGGETTGWGQGSFGMTGEENVLILSSEWDERWGLFSAPLPPLSNSHLHQSHIWEEEVGFGWTPSDCLGSLVEGGRRRRNAKYEPRNKDKKKFIGSHCRSVLEARGASFFLLYEAWPKIL